MISFFADAYLSFLTDLLDFSLNSYRRVYRLMKLITFAFILFHVLVVVINRITFSLKVSEHLFKLIVSLCCCFYRRSQLIIRRSNYRCVFFYYSRILSCVDRSTKSFFVRIKRWSRSLSVLSDVICSSSCFYLACTFISLLRCLFSHLLFNASVYCDKAKRFVTIALELSLITSITLSRLTSIFLDHWRLKLSNTLIYEFLSPASDFSCRVILSW